MTKYQELIDKIKKLKTHHSCSSTYFLCKNNWNFSQAELALIQDALETMQFLEIFFKERSENEPN